jgi:hypothetical protein
LQKLKINSEMEEEEEEEEEEEKEEKEKYICRPVVFVYLSGSHLPGKKRRIWRVATLEIELTFIIAEGKSLSVGKLYFSESKFFVGMASSPKL